MIFKGILALARRVSFGFFTMLERWKIFSRYLRQNCRVPSEMSCSVKTVVVENCAKRVVIGSR